MLRLKIAHTRFTATTEVCATPVQILSLLLLTMTQANPDLRSTFPPNVSFSYSSYDFYGPLVASGTRTPDPTPQRHEAFRAPHVLDTLDPRLHQCLRYGPLSQVSTNPRHQDAFGGHICQLATMPSLTDLTIEYMYHDFSRRTIPVHAEGGITICDILAAAEKLMVIDLDRPTANDPYGQTAERRGEVTFPCQRQETYFDHLRKSYGEAGLLKSESGEEVWELRYGRITRKSIDHPHRNVVNQLLLVAF